MHFDGGVSAGASGSYGLHANSAEASTDVTVKGWGSGLAYRF
jgi:hypothetical protein